MVEATLEDPKQVLRAQERAARDRAMAEIDVYKRQRQPFLAKAFAAAKVGEPLRSFYIHGSAYVRPAVPPDRFCS